MQRLFCGSTPGAGWLRDRAKAKVVTSVLRILRTTCFGARVSDARAALCPFAWTGLAFLVIATLCRFSCELRLRNRRRDPVTDRMAPTCRFRSQQAIEPIRY